MVAEDSGTPPSTGSRPQFYAGKKKERLTLFFFVCGGPEGNRTPIYRMQTDCSTTKLQAQIYLYSIVSNKKMKEVGDLQDNKAV